MASLLRPVGAALASLALAAGSLLAANPSQAADTLTLKTGHIDAFNLTLDENNALKLNLKEDATGSHVPHAPEDVKLVVGNHAYVQNVPGGLPEGVPTDFYYLPINQDHSLIWPGWDSLQAQPKFGSDLKSEIAIQSVDGPGDVYLWSQAGFGGPASVMKDGGFKLPNTIVQNMAAHVHANWAFTEPGTYTFTVQATASKADGSAKETSNTAKYTFVVEPRPTEVSVSGADAPVAAGAQVTLTAAAGEGEQLFNKVTWQKAAAGSNEWAPVDGGNATTLSAGASDAGAASTLTVTAAEGDKYRAVTTGGKDFATSAPIEVVSNEVVIKVAEPQPEPTDEPTTEPTPEPTPEPTDEATPEPTDEPTPEPTDEATPEPTTEPTDNPGDDTGAPEGNGPSASASSDDADNAGNAPVTSTDGDGGNAGAPADSRQDAASGASANNANAANGTGTTADASASKDGTLAETGADVTTMGAIAIAAIVTAALGIALVGRRAQVDD
ncbi:choice-of-anchor M domain-containing protein [Gulosibacter bifidus]|uniref:Choice-of-anchor M domain-containing protein n=1 Tax=Gulosibacter bifidus TaxID=272239 RepID=A0ABW5RJT9_9MICO|nr:choice-of-anchor M domain-containing protein [Gulosibacter bifidus]